MTIRKTGVFQPHLLAAAVALGVATQAGAVDFELGEIQGKFDSTLSIGGSWSTRNPDKNFISNNSGTGVVGKGSARVIDDGRQNFRAGENFSTVFKGLHDLELKYGDSGAFVRGKYWYDFEQKDGSQHFYDISDQGRDQAASASGGQILDAFVYHNYTVADLPGNVRLGKQVVSWGESTFIPNGINTINPVDVSALRSPGSEVKEALVPVPMLYLSQGLTDNLTAEGFYQLEWKPTVVDNCGTFFGSDSAATGCDDRNVVAGRDLAPGVAQNTGGAAAVATGRDDVYLPRGSSRDARDSGQFGLALRWFLPDFNDTELGAYAMNYHSRGPYISETQTIGRYTPIAGLPPAVNAAQAQFAAIRGANYFLDYPEDIRLYGLSFATNISGLSLNGEISYRPNMPLQINTPDLTSAASGNRVSPIFVSGTESVSPGAIINGYKRMPFTQAQVTATKLFNQVLGADRLTLVGEVGYDHISGIGPADGTDLRFGRNPVFGGGELPGAANASCIGTGVGTPGASNPQQQCNNNGFYTTSSWGYRLRGQLDYPNAIAGVNLSPNMAFSHDVNGFGPTFEEGVKAVSLGLGADYRNTYTASLAYTDFFGGRFNTATDRDFVSLSFGVNF
ncbi:DUF1302 domain-containing protein [Pseudomonas sp. Pse1]|uniref:DUF1302 domain-containing protein n=1 Tax=Pseudomonas sp. Pse1 TaxID=2926020 RepID=UPI0021187E3B|nr:DUF1302 domain-containing protein [Pseudomonas sp. Pse1]